MSDRQAEDEFIVGMRESGKMDQILDAMRGSSATADPPAEEDDTGEAASEDAPAEDADTADEDVDDAGSAEAEDSADSGTEDEAESGEEEEDRKSTRLNSSHQKISY